MDWKTDEEIIKILGYWWTDDVELPEGVANRVLLGIMNDELSERGIDMRVTACNVLDDEIEWVLVPLKMAGAYA